MGDKCSGLHLLGQLLDGLREKMRGHKFTQWHLQGWLLIFWDCADGWSSFPQAKRLHLSDILFLPLLVYVSYSTNSVSGKVFVQGKQRKSFSSAFNFQLTGLTKRWPTVFSVASHAMCWSSCGQFSCKPLSAGVREGLYFTQQKTMPNLGLEMLNIYVASSNRVRSFAGFDLCT